MLHLEMLPGLFDRLRRFRLIFRARQAGSGEQTKNNGGDDGSHAWDSPPVGTGCASLQILIGAPGC